MKRKNTKASGTAFENRVKHYLEELGWVVMRSAASKSCADLVAFGRDGLVLWVQCKASEKPGLTPEEKMELFKGQKFLDVISLIVCRRSNTWEFIYYVFEGKTSKLVEVEEPAWMIL